MKRTKFLIYLLIFSITFLLMNADTFCVTIYVSFTGNDNNNGLSWDNAKNTIQAGIDLAKNGDTVLVKYGSYKITSSIILEGKAVKLASDDGTHDNYDNATKKPELCTIDAGSNCRIFEFHNGETSDSVVSGFTITDGLAPVSDNSRHGGGILCNSSSPTIRNCIITENVAEHCGGGIACISSASPVIEECRIAENSAMDWAYGGGIYCENGSAPIVKNCVIVENRSNPWGAGIGCISSSPTISECIIMRNSAKPSVDGRGGGICCSRSSSVDVINCIVAQNEAGCGGGGVFCSNTSFVNILNCTIADNKITREEIIQGGGIAFYNQSSLNISNTILWNNKPQQIYHSSMKSVNISYSDIEGGRINGIEKVDPKCNKIEWKAGNISVNPKFIDPGNGDYHLQSSSPCLGAGTDKGAPSTDKDGHSRPLGEIDIGAYEQRDDGSFPVETLIKGSTLWGDVKHSALLQNYPNPFNPETWIPFQLAEDAQVSIRIYSSFGQNVTELSLGRLSAGEYVDKDKAVYWDGRNRNGEEVSSGVYFYQIQAGEWSETKKMVIIR